MGDTLSSPFISSWSLLFWNAYPDRSQVELVDGLEEPSELSMAVGENDTGF